MTLEEKISFYSRESAGEFQKFLRSKDCGSHITVEHTFSGEPYFEGSIAEFISLIARLEKQDEADGETDEDLAEIKKDLEDKREKLIQFFATHKEGDILQNATPMQMMAQVESIDTENDKDLRKNATEKFVSQLMILTVLEDNDLLQPTENGKDYVLTKTAEADNLRIMYAYTEFPKVSPEDLEECGLSSHIRTSSETSYCVSAGLELLFCETDDIIEFLDDADVDEEESGRFIDAIFFKQALLGKIHELIGNGCSSAETLGEELAKPAFPLEGSKDVISFDISPEYLSAVLADMKKMGIIAGKDNKLKNT